MNRFQCENGCHCIPFEQSKRPGTDALRCHGNGKLPATMHPFVTCSLIEPHVN